MDIKLFLIYLAICFGLSFLIGVERQYRRRIIGLRTTILVSVGAFLYVSMSFSVDGSDLTRIAAQVVSGIGFLGAGVIIKDGLKIRGLTTAATLWCDAAIGVLCASGAIYQAIAGTFVILFSNVVLRYVNVLINEKTSPRHIEEIYEVEVVCDKDTVTSIKGVVNDFIRTNSKAGVELRGIDIVDESDYSVLSFKLNVAKLLNRGIQKLIDNIYGKHSIKKLVCNKIMEVENEEEEEAL